jgi:hypothetical protein
MQTRDEVDKYCLAKSVTCLMPRAVFVITMLDRWDGYNTMDWLDGWQGALPQAKLHYYWCGHCLELSKGARPPEPGVNRDTSPATSNNCCHLAGYCCLAQSSHLICLTSCSRP